MTYYINISSQNCSLEKMTNWFDHAMRTTENAIVRKTNKSMDRWSDEGSGSTGSEKLGTYRIKNREDQRAVPVAVKILKEL